MRNLIFILLFIPCICQAQIQPDKQLHLAGGAFAGSFGTWVGSVYFDKPEKSALIGLGVTALATGGKELLDMGTGGHPEMADVYYSMAGGIIGAGLVYAGMKIFQRKIPYLSFNEKFVTFGIIIKI